MKLDTSKQMEIERQARSAQGKSWRALIEHCDQNPMAAVTAATGAIVGSFALVLGGIGGIQLVMQ